MPRSTFALGTNSLFLECIDLSPIQGDEGQDLPMFEEFRNGTS
jgi:hypothetical protein